VRRAGAGAAGAALALACGSAAAHSPVPGIGHFYSGMLHPMLATAHLLALLAVGLWLGQHWPARLRELAALLLALAAGLVLSGPAPWPGLEQALLALCVLAAGTAAAAARTLPPALSLSAAAAIGLVMGLDSAPDGLTGRPLWLSLAGSWVGVLLGLAALAALSEWADKPWMKVAARVVSSWLAAAAILVLALAWAEIGRAHV
jgi:urease accessory protein